MNRGVSVALGFALYHVSAAYSADTDPLDRAIINVCGSGVVHVCPSTLRGDSVATLTIGGQHPTGFAVRRPDGSWVDLAGDGVVYTSLENFSALAKFVFLPEVLIGTEWIDGRPTERRVFLGAGRYIFYFANNLDTEPENTYSIALAVEFVK
jgi:hypothetical protein